MRTHAHRHRGKHFLLVLVIAGLAISLTLVAASPAAAVRTHWAIPYPFASTNPIVTSGVPTIAGPRRALNLAAGAGSLYRARNLKWSRWGKTQVQGRGRALYCSDSCVGGWRRVRIVLLRPRAVYCGDGARPAFRHYTRYRVRGFAFITHRGAFRSGSASC